MDLMKKILLLLVFTSSLSVYAGDKEEINSLVLSKGSQWITYPVTPQYSYFNISEDWALVFGEFVQSNGLEVDWDKVDICDGTLDAALWGIFHKVDNHWRAVEFDVCAIEPPYWYVDLQKTEWPCSIFKGIKFEEEYDMQEKCMIIKEKY
jgi:hypothetical protein